MTRSEMFNSIMTNYPEIIIFKDTEGNILEINKYCEEAIAVLGLNKKDIIGKNEHEVLDKKIAEEYRKNDLEVIKNEKATVFKEPHPSDTEKHIIDLKLPVYDKENKICGICGIGFSSIIEN
jgi:PAS domain S-box-containing protein